MLRILIPPNSPGQTSTVVYGEIQWFTKKKMLVYCCPYMEAVYDLRFCPYTLREIYDCNMASCITEKYDLIRTPYSST